MHIPPPPTTFRNARLAKRLERLCGEVTPLTARKMLDIELESAARSAGRTFGICRAELLARAEELEAQKAAPQELERLRAKAQRLRRQAAQVQKEIEAAPPG